MNQAIEQGEAGLQWFRDGLPIPERVMFSTVAEAQERVGPWTLLQERGVVPTEPLLQAEKNLVQWRFLTLLEVAVLDYTYVTVELVRRWLVKR